MRRDRAHRLERRLREQRAHAARVFAFPASSCTRYAAAERARWRRAPRSRARPVCDGGGGGRVAAHAREHDPARSERLEPHRNRLHQERAARFGDAVQELGAGVREGATGRVPRAATRARAPPATGVSIRLAATMEMPSRAMSESSSPPGSALRMSTSLSRRASITLRHVLLS